MLNQKKLSELKPGEDIEHYLLLSRLELKTTKSSKEYLDMELRDMSASLNAKMWGGFEDFVSSVKEGSVVKVRGKLDDYQGQPQIKVELIRFAREDENISPKDFMPKSKRDLDEMKLELDSKISSVKNKHLKSLLSKIFSGERLEKFVNSPAGKSWHHSYIHGLLEHTLEIVRVCELTCEFHPTVNRDLLVTGTLLHDFGKTEELNADTNFDYTDKGKLLGHIVIAAMLVKDTASKIKGFPEELENQLLHLILSHQGKHEFQSPVEPKTVEAIILYHADELSAKANAYKSAIENEKGGRGNWTRYLPLAETALYTSSLNSISDEEPKENLFDI